MPPAPTDLDRAYLAACERGDWAEVDRLEPLVDAQGAAEQQHLTAPGALKAAALWYAGRGIAVFPLCPQAKVPATAHGFKDATTDPDVIASWWTTTPEANIGAPTGRTFDVIDIDGPEGVLSVAPMLTELLPVVLGIVKTGRVGGMHLYVPPRPEARNRSGLYPGVDYRGAGGYVVVPPSLAANGQRYRWLRPLELGPAATQGGAA